MDKKKTKVTWKRVLAVCLAVTLALYSGVQLSDHVLRASEEQEPQATQTVRSNEDVDVASEGGQKTGSQEEQKTEKTEEVVLSEDAPASGGSSDNRCGGCNRRRRRIRFVRIVYGAYHAQNVCNDRSECAR